MPNLDIFIHREGEPPIHDLEKIQGRIDRADPQHAAKIVLIEKGMASGAPAISIFVPFAGRWIVAENSLANLQMALAAARGAFPEAFVGGTFDPTHQPILQRVREILNQTAKDSSWRVREALKALDGMPTDD